MSVLGQYSHIQMALRDVFDFDMGKWPGIRRQIEWTSRTASPTKKAAIFDIEEIGTFWRMAWADRDKSAYDFVRAVISVRNVMYYHSFSILTLFN